MTRMSGSRHHNDHSHHSRIPSPPPVTVSTDFASYSESGAFALTSGEKRGDSGEEVRRVGVSCSSAVLCAGFIAR